ncbi:hypothetical protein GRI89_09305 [Altererythrobacter salegens]|uniref:DUF2946 domain-containing protein n=1 Tax=Croceibacterium salegens TaxID=1737568 RepID=A0A6I4SUS0_9SPHN|nr:hypothetical protein [Croceibacterium salegens]MXO59735.1 hypothetical protein [Croceibacterium salegens]
MIHCNARSHFWRALVCAALLVQCVFVQSHIHPAAAQARTAVLVDAADRHAAATTDSTTPATEYCLQCWEAAMAGSYVQPAATFVLPLPLVLVWGGIAAMAEWSLRQPPRGWFGRAPPQ